MIEIVPKNNITASDIKIIRDISSLSISDIKSAAVNGTAVRNFHIFGSSWESEKKELVKAHELYSKPYAPFIVKDSVTGSHLSPDDLYNKFKFWRSIELETQRNIDLESGEINSYEEFVPHDDNWA